MANQFFAREIQNDPAGSSVQPDEGNDGGYFWSQKGQIIKYVVTAVVVILLLLWVFGGMWHANRRIKQGKRPLFYHRWLAPSFLRQSGRANMHGAPLYGRPAPHTRDEQWNMNNWNYAMPPPSYTHDAPPEYTIPTKDAGTTTVNPVGDSSPRPDAASASPIDATRPPPGDNLPRAPEQIHSPTDPSAPAPRYA